MLTCNFAQVISLIMRAQSCGSRENPPKGGFFDDSRIQRRLVAEEAKLASILEEHNEIFLSKVVAVRGLLISASMREPAFSYRNVPPPPHCTHILSTRWVDKARKLFLSLSLSRWVTYNMMFMQVYVYVKIRTRSPKRRNFSKV
jgi:hypothetical protein